MLSKLEIEGNSDQITFSAREAWLLLFRGSTVYQTRAYAFTDLEARLDAADGTTKGRMLNALLIQIEELGSGEAMLVPGSSKGGVQYSQRLEREALITEAFGLLYDVAAMTTTIYSVDRVAAAGTRSTYGPCNRCSTNGEIVYRSNCRCNGSDLNGLTC